MNHRNELSKRLLSFAINVIKYSRKLPNHDEYRVIKYQLIKSATSAGANYKEAQSGSSRADFRNKVNIALKEVAESHYWLLIISEIIDSKILKEKLNILRTESNELTRILGTIIQKVGKANT